MKDKTNPLQKSGFFIFQYIYNKKDMRFTLNESERNSIRNLYIEKGVLSEQMSNIFGDKDKVKPGTPNDPIYTAKGTDISIGGNYVVTAPGSKTPLGIMSPSVTYYSDGSGDSYAEIKTKDGITLYATCNNKTSTLGDAYGRIYVKSGDVDRIPSEKTKISWVKDQQVKIGDKTESVKVLDAKTLLGTLNSKLDKYNKQFCRSYESLFK